MAMQSNPEHDNQGTEVDSKAPEKETVIIQDMGAATEKTMGGFGPHSENGIPPFNQHT